MARFTQAMMRAIHRQIAANNPHRLVGVIVMRVTLDRHSRPLACSARRGPLAHRRLLPSDTIVSSTTDLVALVSAQCWLTDYPKAPAHLFDPTGTVEIVAPIILQPRWLPTQFWLSRQFSPGLHLRS